MYHETILSFDILLLRVESLLQVLELLMMYECECLELRIKQMIHEL